MPKAWRYLWIAFVTAGCMLSIRFVIVFWEEPWPYPVLTIDGQSYMKGAAGAAEAARQRRIADAVTMPQGQIRRPPSV